MIILFLIVLVRAAGIFFSNPKDLETKDALSECKLDVLKTIPDAKQTLQGFAIFEKSLHSQLIDKEHLVTAARLFRNSWTKDSTVAGYAICGLATYIQLLATDSLTWSYNVTGFDKECDFLPLLKKYAQNKIENHETVIFGGDYNIIPGSDDAVDINKWKNDALHHPDSIKIYREIINLGLSDVLRIYNSKPYEFTYWDYSRGSWEKDNGLRIDHFLATPSAVDRITDCQIEKQFRGLERPSDHVPIWFEIK